MHICRNDKNFNNLNPNKFFISSQSSPFCGARPKFTLAETKDLIVICGEFRTDVEILEQSRELEQVFMVNKIVNHPNYEPNGVNQHT